MQPPPIPPILPRGFQDLVDALRQVEVASTYAWVRVVIGWCIVAGSVLRVAIPIYIDWRRTHGGNVLETPSGPMSYKHACEVALDENLRLGLRVEALERALSRASAAVDCAKANCEKTVAEMRAQHAAEIAKCVNENTDLRARLAALSRGFGDPGVGE